ncbi:MAG: tetratricopeptide repeat protein [Chthoniobacterales bacterium]
MRTITLLFWLVTAGAFAAGSTNDIASLKALAKSGDAQAMFQLGRAYYRGEGVEKDPKAGATFVTKAAEAGFPEAIENMGVIYYRGNGVPLNERTAEKWFRRGAEAGSIRSKFNLGVLLREGKSIDRSNEESMKLLKEAADHGMIEAQAYLGFIYYSGDALQTSDWETAWPYLLAAAKAGDAAAQNNLGLICEKGFGPDLQHKDKKIAEDWFRKAALQNNAKAQANLAFILGVASPQSPHLAEATKWLIISANQNEITALKRLQELETVLPPAILIAAKQEAARFAIESAAKAAAQTAETSAQAEPSPSASPPAE